MIRRTALRALILPFAAILAAGCAGPMYHQPEVTLQGVQVGGLGLRGGTLLVNVKVVNPNRFALNANQLEYSVALRDTRQAADTTWIDFASGIYAQPFSVAARDSATVQIPVEFTYSGLGTAGLSLIRAGTFDYQARGVVDLRTPVGPYQVPFRRQGTFVPLSGRE